MPRRWWWFAARSSMARKYIRKGGHGGARSGSGLPVGFWQERGGKKAAAGAKNGRQKRSGKGGSGSMRAEAALAGVGSGTCQCIRAGQWAAGSGAEGIRAAANPNSRARSAVRTVCTRVVVDG